MLGTFNKQPAEVLDYVIDFADFFVGRADVPFTQVTTADAGITVTYSGLSGTLVRIVLSGGVDGESYKVTTMLTTSASPAIVREANFTVRVKDI